jgi:general secretion pathway protein B
MLNAVAIADLKPGMMVTQVLEQNGPVKIRRVGMVKSDAMVKGLSEMGVILLEVDQAQSVSIDDEPTMEPSPSQSLSPTQRMMASDKQLSTADRNLSHQFHRSLFMPAIDDMPSKWKLYAQPYALLLVISLLGFATGFTLMQLPKWFAASETVQSVKVMDGAVNAMLEETPSPPVVPTADNTVEDESATVNNQTQAVQPEPDEDEDDQQTQVASSESVAQTTNESDNPQQLQSINGIILNEGETILGYNAPSSEQEDADSVPASQDVINNDTTPDEGLSQALLQRVNQVAAQVDQQAQSRASNETRDESLLNDMLEEVKRQGLIPVTRPVVEPIDNNEFDEGASQERAEPVRIDQLPASVLTQMPAMSFSVHIYASNPLDRWVRVNGRRLSEGDEIANGLSIVEIAPEKIVLTFQGEVFSMNALSDW